MTIISTQRSNQGSSAIDHDGFIGFGSAGFDEDDLEITGDEVDNFLDGGIGHEIIEGRDGNDIINGGEGNDLCTRWKVVSLPEMPQMSNSACEWSTIARRPLSAEHSDYGGVALVKLSCRSTALLGFLSTSIR